MSSTDFAFNYSTYINDETGRSYLDALDALSNPTANYRRFLTHYEPNDAIDSYVGMNDFDFNTIMANPQAVAFLEEYMANCNLLLESETINSRIVAQPGDATILVDSSTAAESQVFGTTYHDQSLPEAVEPDYQCYPRYTTPQYDALTPGQQEPTIPYFPSLIPAYYQGHQDLSDNQQSNTRMPAQQPLVQSRLYNISNQSLQNVVCTDPTTSDNFNVSQDNAGASSHFSNYSSIDFNAPPPPALQLSDSASAPVTEPESSALYIHSNVPEQCNVDPQQHSHEQQQEDAEEDQAQLQPPPPRRLRNRRREAPLASQASTSAFSIDSASSESPSSSSISSSSSTNSVAPHPLVAKLMSGWDVKAKRLGQPKEIRYSKERVESIARSKAAKEMRDKTYGRTKTSKGPKLVKKKGYN